MQLRTWFLCIIASLTAISLAPSTGSSQEDAAAIPKFDFAAAAAEYEISAGPSRVICEPFQVELLKWSNPVRSTAAGTVFMWHNKGVPQAACCMYAYAPNGGGDYFVDHEFVSLSPELIEAKSAGETAWQTRKPGITWREIPQGPVVARTRAGRLAQMRQMASEFTGRIGKAGKRSEELRLLRQPVYRYPETIDLDGSIFVFAQATDPEILLRLQADLKGPDLTWKFAAARMTMVACSLNRDETEVWSVGWHSQNNDDAHTYLTRHRVPWKSAESSVEDK